MTCRKQKVIQKTRIFIFNLNIFFSFGSERIIPWIRKASDSQTPSPSILALWIHISMCSEKHPTSPSENYSTFSHKSCDSTSNNCMSSQNKGLPVNFAVGVSIHSLFGMENTFLVIKHCKILWKGGKYN